MRYPGRPQAEDPAGVSSRRLPGCSARDGVGATGLQPLMKALGLTHGGFYAHFKSKDDLVETALRHAAAQLDEITAPLAEAERPLALLIEQYLSPRHRDNPGAGCPLPTLSAELGQRGTPSPTTDSIVRKRLAMIEASLEGEDAGERAVLLPLRWSARCNCRAACRMRRCRNGYWKRRARSCWSRWSARASAEVALGRPLPRQIGREPGPRRHQRLPIGRIRQRRDGHRSRRSKPTSAASTRSSTSITISAESRRFRRRCAPRYRYG